MKKKELLIICPNEQRKFLLRKKSQEKKLSSISFMTIEEFINQYFYAYDERALSFLMHEYQISLAISKIYLESLYPIDVEKCYHSRKLEFLKKIKRQLIEKNLLIFSPYFKEFLKTKKIKVSHYPRLERYLLTIFQELGAEIEESSFDVHHDTVYEAQDIYDEVTFVAERIMELYQKGIPFCHMYIVNVQEEYDYPMKRIFEMFQIPIALPERDSMISIPLVQKYLVTKTLPKMDDQNQKIVQQLIDIKNELLSIEKDSNYMIFLKDRLKKTKVSSVQYQNCVQVCDLFDREYEDQDYVFLVGFREGIFPILYKDEDYITDDLKGELALFSTIDKNKREKEIIKKTFCSIPHLFMSYCTTGFHESYYPSSMISDLSMKVVAYQKSCFGYSDSYNLRMLSIYLDQYYKYKEENPYLKPLYKTYHDSILYHTYSNQYTGISKDEFLRAMGTILLSYTSMNHYHLCPFRYYVHYVLKLDPFEETFDTFIGNLFHFILEHSYEKDFQFEYYWNQYLEDRTFSLKEQFFLERLKQILYRELECMKEQEENTDFKNTYLEKNISIPLNCQEIEAIFTGKIDKIMYYPNALDSYFAIVDYKTGGFDANLYNMKYGLGMQLATYLYLVEKSHLFENPIFTGMYFQRVLLGNVRYDGKKSYLDKMRENLKLVGYSTDQEEILAHFDHEYTDSKMIQGMKITKNGFARYTKLLSKEEEYLLFQYTENIIQDTLKQIVNTHFSIQPKKIDGSDVSCKHCKYRDLCYRKEDDYEYLEKVEDFSFLGGEEDGKQMDRGTVKSD